MDGNANHLSAYRVCSNDVMVYRVADGKYYFDPEAPVSKIQGRYRMRLWLKCNADKEFIAALRTVLDETPQGKKSDLFIATDINPYSMS